MFSTTWELGFRNSLPALQRDVPLDDVSIVDAYVAVFWSLQHGRWAIVLYGRDLIDDGCMFRRMSSSLVCGHVSGLYLNQRVRTSWSADDVP